MQQLREHNPEDAKCRRELAASLLAADGSAHLNTRLTLQRPHASREQGLRQQQRPAKPERIASELPEGAKDTSGTEEEG